MIELKRRLWKEYGGFADKRIRHLEHGRTFIVDDRNENDVGADGKLYATFCMVFADVSGDNEVVVHLSGNIPLGPKVEAWQKKHKVEMHGRTCEFKLSPGNYEILIPLATAIESIIAAGERYDIPSYKDVCPRTAKSLRRLHRLLNLAWAAGPIGFGL